MIDLMRRHEQDGDDSHRLLRVIGPVPKRVERRGNDLKPAEQLVHAARRRFPEDPGDRDHVRVTQEKPRERGDEDEQNREDFFSH